MSPKRAQRRSICLGAILSAALLVTLCPAEQHPASSQTSVSSIVRSELDDVRANVAELCEPHCGEVLLESSEETKTAESQRIANGISRISYNDRFITNVLSAYGGSVVFAIVAHEYGHHLDYISYGSDWTREVRADGLAGCALARRRDPLGPTLRWMRHEHFKETAHDVFDDPKDPWEVVREYTNTHPPWLERIRALMRGVELCGNGKRPSAVAEILGGAKIDEYGLGHGATLAFGEHRSTHVTRASLVRLERPLWDAESMRALYSSFTPSF